MPRWNSHESCLEYSQRSTIDMDSNTRNKFIPIAGWYLLEIKKNKLIFVVSKATGMETCIYLSKPRPRFKNTNIIYHSRQESSYWQRKWPLTGPREYICKWTESKEATFVIGWNIRLRIPFKDRRYNPQNKPCRFLCLSLRLLVTTIFGDGSDTKSEVSVVKIIVFPKQSVHRNGSCVLNHLKWRFVMSCYVNIF